MNNLFDDLQLKKEEFGFCYTDREDDDILQQYVRAHIVDDDSLGHGIRFHKGVCFTIKPEDAKRFGQWLIEAADLFIERDGIDRTGG